MSIFTGSAVALVTPFLENGDVDYDKLKELVEFHIAHKTDAIVICGTTGEASTLSHEEHLECVKKCVEFADRSVISAVTRDALNWQSICAVWISCLLT